VNLRRFVYSFSAWARSSKRPRSGPSPTISGETLGALLGTCSKSHLQQKTDDSRPSHTVKTVTLFPSRDNSSRGSSE
jgi:hypothetical protein